MFDRHFVGKLRLKKKIYSSTNGVNSTEMIENLSLIQQLLRVVQNLMTSIFFPGSIHSDHSIIMNYRFLTIQQNMRVLHQGGRGHLAVYYTRPQSWFLIRWLNNFSHFY